MRDILPATVPCRLELGMDLMQMRGKCLDLVRCRITTHKADTCDMIIGPCN